MSHWDHYIRRWCTVIYRTHHVTTFVAGPTIIRNPLLFENVRRTRPQKNSVVCLSSVTHHVGCTEWESSAGGHKGHRGRSTYADGKLAMVLFAKVRGLTPGLRVYTGGLREQSHQGLWPSRPDNDFITKTQYLRDSLLTCTNNNTFISPTRM